MAITAARIATAILACALLLLSLAMLVAARGTRPRLAAAGSFGGAFLLLAIGLLAQAIAPMTGLSPTATLVITIIGLVAILAGLLRVVVLWRQYRSDGAAAR